MVLVTIEEIQERIVELELIKSKPKIADRYQNSDEYIDDLIRTNYYYLHILQNERH